MRTLKAKGERFHVSGTCTWPAHPGSGSAEVGSSGWKSTAASRGVGAPAAPLENPEDRVPPAPGRTHNASGLQGKGKSAKWIRNRGKGLARGRAGRGGSQSNPSAVGGLLELLSGGAGRQRCRRGDGLGAAPLGAFGGVEQPTQN
ncbi:hypothetical protein H6P81_021211 [Aristolochia fimbriata]|uniref:Uncharacterized protein n=1 Tax=Aristolochia fimbriata TaxID=158543 RepID=A0AAV7DTF1_ARIFI|nr:hypothetical protein H6P81_021211 [Aristolochia fimbriata]